MQTCVSQYKSIHAYHRYVLPTQRTTSPHTNTHLHGDHFDDDVSGVDIESTNGLDFASVSGSQVANQEADQRVQVLNLQEGEEIDQMEAEEDKEARRRIRRKRDW